MKVTPTVPDLIPVILIRHAQSQWNLENRFTGWADPALTEAGVNEAVEAGEFLRDEGYRFDTAFSSRLRRAITTLDILLEHLQQTDIQRASDWRLNERHYGALQGIDKDRATAEAGEVQVWRWRRGYLDRAAPMSRADLAHPIHDKRYCDIDPTCLPDVENLAETRNRVMQFWHANIKPRIQNAERLLISAHGNTLRALIMDLAGMSEPEVESFEIPTAMPIRFDFNRNGETLGWRYLTAESEIPVQAA